MITDAQRDAFDALLDNGQGPYCERAESDEEPEEYDEQVWPEDEEE